MCTQAGFLENEADPSALCHDWWAPSPYPQAQPGVTDIRLRNSVGLNPTSSVVVLQISRHKSSQYDNINPVIARRALAMAQIAFLTFS